MSSENLESKFPSLKKEGYRITSDATTDYNCIAWAIEKDDLVWWPDTMDQFPWPQNLAREEQLQIFTAFFSNLVTKFVTAKTLNRALKKLLCTLMNMGEALILRSNLKMASGRVS